MTRLFLIRHGESALGVQRRYAGHVDCPLTARGRREVLDLLPLFRRHDVSRIYSSDLRRCRETARILAGDRPVYFTRHLREMDFGLWDGLTSEQIRATHSDLYTAWINEPSQVTPPGGESLISVARRVRGFAGHLAWRHPEGSFALVTHGGPVRLLLSRDPSDFWSKEILPASLTLLEWTRETRI